MIRIVVVDDRQLFRTTLRVLIDSDPDLEVVGKRATVPRATEVARETTPNVVLMDVRMPHMDGVEATGVIAADPSLRGTRVLVLTTFEIDEHVEAAIPRGCYRFRRKEIEPDELLAAIRRVATGELV